MSMADDDRHCGTQRPEGMRPASSCCDAVTVPFAGHAGAGPLGRSVMLLHFPTTAVWPTAATPLRPSTPPRVALQQSKLVRSSHDQSIGRWRQPALHSSQASDMANWRAERGELDAAALSAGGSDFDHEAAGAWRETMGRVASLSAHIDGAVGRTAQDVKLVIIISSKIIKNIYFILVYKR